MVVKAPNTAPASSGNNVEAAPAEPLRGVRSAPDAPSAGKRGGNKTQDCVDTEFSRLKNLVPSISKKTTVSKLDVILEAIRYIDSLQDQLIDHIAENKVSVAASALLVGKENANSELLASLMAKSAAAARK